MALRIGTDIGGTFTDLVVARDGQLLARHKAPTTHGDLPAGVLHCLTLAARDLGLTLDALLADTDTFVHGSTVATNAVLEGKGARCGVICTRGTRYTLWRGEGRRQQIFDFSAPPRTPLVRPHLCLELDERIDRHGRVLRALDDDEVLRAIESLRAQDCAAVAVCLLWSVRNPCHEQRIGELLRTAWPEAAYSLSSEVQPILREYPRMSCTVLNSMLKPVVSRYLGQLEASLRERGLAGELLVVTSDGGVQPVEEVSARPVYMLFSGPATGPGAARQFAAAEGATDCLLIDMGGTSFDVSTVIDGRVATTRDGRIDDHPTGVSAVQVLTLGAGGGSIARVDAGGLLRVGPQSAGASPGPACYGRGGRLPTVTDAYLTLGLLVADRFLGGRMQLDAAAAREAIEQHVARPLGISVEDAARGICRVVNERMVNGILDMTVRKGLDPRRLVLVTGGGATGVAAVELARELGITRVLVPRETSVLCAFGALNADLAWSTVASHPTSAHHFDAAAIAGTLEPLLAAGERFLDRLEIPHADRRLDLFVAARYPMQVSEIEVACPGVRPTVADAARIAEAFHAIHRERYAVAEPDADVEFVMWRVVARGLTRPVQRRPLEASRTPNAFDTREMIDLHSGERLRAPLFDVETCGADVSITGPALLLAADTTIVLPVGACARSRRDGYFLIELDNQGASA